MDIYIIYHTFKIENGCVIFYAKNDDNVFNSKNIAQLVNKSHATSELDLFITTAFRNHSYQCWVDIIVSGCANQIITQFCFNSPTPTIFPYQTKYFPVLPLIDRSRGTPVVVIAGCTYRVCGVQYARNIKTTNMYFYDHVSPSGSLSTKYNPLYFSCQVEVVCVNDISGVVCVQITCSRNLEAMLRLTSPRRIRGPTPPVPSIATCSHTSK